MNRAITSEAELTPTKIKLMEDLGKERANATHARNMLKNQHNIEVSKNLLNRVMQKGRDKVWGGNEPEQMSLFYGNGLKLTEFCPVYGTNGRFETTCGENHGELRAWIAQTPLEVVLARVYGQGYPCKLGCKTEFKVELYR